MAKKKTNEPRIIVAGKALTPDEARNVRIVAGCSNPDFPELPPESELERLRDAKDFYKKHVRLKAIENGKLLRILAMQESRYVDDILELAREKAKENATELSSPLRLAIEDPTDQRVWNCLEKDPSMTDVEVARKLNLGRQAINRRRKTLEKLGYPVRVSRQNKQVS